MGRRHSALDLQKRGITDLVSALYEVSNVAPHTQYGVYEYYIIRGMASDQVLYDGIPVEGNRVNTQLAPVAEVQVLKGPVSLLFGNNALGGAINLILKKPTSTLHHDFAVSGGNWDTRRAEGGVGGPLLADRIFYLVDGGYDASTTFRNAGFRRMNLTPTIDWNPDGKDHFSYFVMMNHDQFHGDAGIPMVNGTVPSIAMSTRYNPPHDFEHSDQFNMQGSYLRTLSPENSFRNVISYQHLNDEYREAESISYLPATEMVSREYLYFFHHRRPLLDEANLMGKIHLGLTHHYIFGHLYEHYTNTTNRTTLSQAG